MDTLIADFSTLTVAPEPHVNIITDEPKTLVPYTNSAFINNAFTNSDPVFLKTGAWHPIFHHIQPCGMSNDDYSKLCTDIYYKNISIDGILQKTNIDFARTLFNNGFFTDNEIDLFIQKYSGSQTTIDSHDPRLILHLFYVADINKCQKFLLPYYENIIYALYKIINNFLDPNSADIIKILDWFIHRGIKPNDNIFHFMIKNNEITIVQWILKTTVGTVCANTFLGTNNDPFMWIDDISDHSMITTLLQHGYFPSRQFLDALTAFDNFMYDYIVNFNHHGGD